MHNIVHRPRALNGLPTQTPTNTLRNAPTREPGTGEDHHHKTTRPAEGAPRENQHRGREHARHSGSLTKGEPDHPATGGKVHPRGRGWTTKEAHAQRAGAGGDKRHAGW